MFIISPNGKVYIYIYKISSERQWIFVFQLSDSYDAFAYITRIISSNTQMWDISKCIQRFHKWVEMSNSKV